VGGTELAAGALAAAGLVLDQAGYVPVAMGTQENAERMQQTFDKSNAYWALDHAPDWVMDAMLGADVVIGLDSGMVHVAGLLRVPTLCLHAHLPPEFLFSHAPTVRSLSPKTCCVHCRWQHDRGFNEGCATQCSALSTVGPEEVMGMLNQVADGPHIDCFVASLRLLRGHRGLSQPTPRPLRARATWID
jgi:hypothetical protein